MVARKTKTEAEVRKEIMKKEWSMSKCTPLSLERLVRMGVLHAQELAGWHAPDLEPFLDPK
jgi:predicted transcriptional regulator